MMLTIGERINATRKGVAEAIETLLRTRDASIPDDVELEPGVPWLMINSISAEAERYEKVMPLVKKYNCTAVALCMGDGEMPATADERIEVGAALVERLAADGVDALVLSLLQHVYIRRFLRISKTQDLALIPGLAPGDFPHH